MEWAIGVDVGGTFTDFYLHNTTTGSFYIGKTPSTPHNPAEAIVTGLLDICKKPVSYTHLTLPTIYSV